MEGVSSQKSPIDQVLDLVVYAPVGIALTAREELPRMIEKGRQRISGQVTLARMLGQLAVAQGQHEASKVARQAGDALVGLGILRGDSVGTPAPGGRVGDPSAARPGEAAAPWPPDAGSSLRPDAGSSLRPDAGAEPPASPVGGSGPANGSAPAPGGEAPSSGDLAIPGYDSLSASQVVQRLAGLDSAELEAVRAYEASTRGRRTILNRIAQLQTGAS
jgi:hypothetical protein